MMTNNSKIVWAWHVHHCTLVEPLMYPYECRVEYILSAKPKSEQPLRLRLFRRVRGQLPARLKRASSKHIEAQAQYAAACRNTSTYNNYRKTFLRARLAEHGYYQAYADCLPEIEALHAQECPDCPWDGKTIFS